MEEYRKAKATLCLETDRFTAAELKRAYLKRALICHPDKNQGNQESTFQFQELQASYAYLSTFVVPEEEEENEEDQNDATTAATAEGDRKEKGGSGEGGGGVGGGNRDATDVILAFMKDVLHGKYHHVFIDLVCGMRTLSLTALEKINKQQLQNIYDFLKRYGKALFLPDAMIQAVKDILDKKETHLEICYTVSPTLNDLLGDKLYKLTLDETTYLVPLWHNEVWYDGKTKGQDIVVACTPTLPENVALDSDNNLYVQEKIALHPSLLKETYVLTLGQKSFVLPINQLHLTAERQTLCLPNCGILKINEDNFYDVSKRSHVYVLVELI